MRRDDQAAFLDRDGVINRAVVRHGKPYPPADVAEVEILPGVADAVARLRSAGYAVVVVTNQPDIARGTHDAGRGGRDPRPHACRARPRRHPRLPARRRRWV